MARAAWESRQATGLWGALFPRLVKNQRGCNLVVQVQRHDTVLVEINAVVSRPLEGRHLIGTCTVAEELDEVVGSLLGGDHIDRRDRYSVSTNATCRVGWRVEIRVVVWCSIAVVVGRW